MSDNSRNMGQKSEKPAEEQGRSDLKIRDMLIKGEEVKLQARIHPAIYWKGVAILIFALLVSTQTSVLGAFFGAVGALTLCYEVLLKKIMMLVVTNKRILVRYGLLQVEVVDMHFDKIESIELERMVPGYIFGYANVVILGTGNRYIRVPYIANAPEFRRAYNEMVLSDKEG